jgi:hypothetical protein
VGSNQLVIYSAGLLPNGYWLAYPQPIPALCVDEIKSLVYAADLLTEIKEVSPFTQDFIITGMQHNYTYSNSNNYSIGILQYLLLRKSVNNKVLN